MTKVLQVDLREMTYPIHVGQNCLALLPDYVLGQQCLIVSNETVAPLYLEKLKILLSDKQCDSVVLPDGEQFKTEEEWRAILAVLFEGKHRRTTTVIALGGGVVGDVAGFAASTYLRGVNFIQVPTSLLAQVDASVGGKTAINAHGLKNSIGSFYQPKAVIIDMRLLETLPERDFVAGLAELVKHGIIHSVDFFDWLEANMDALLNRREAVLQEAIYRSVAIKAALVELDEKDHDCRALLNFGHSFAHAYEAVSQFELLHGEAVHQGMCAATALSCRQGYLSIEQRDRVLQLLNHFAPNVSFPKEASQLVEMMLADKKNMGENSRLVLLRGIGEAFITEAVPREVLITCFTENK